MIRTYPLHAAVALCLLSALVAIQLVYRGGCSRMRRSELVSNWSLCDDVSALAIVGVDTAGSNVVHIAPDRYDAYVAVLSRIGMPAVRERPSSQMETSESMVIGELVLHTSVGNRALCFVGDGYRWDYHEDYRHEFTSWELDELLYHDIAGCPSPVKDWLETRAIGVKAN